MNRNHCRKCSPVACMSHYQGCGCSHCISHVSTSEYEGGHRLHDQDPYARHGKSSRKGILKSFTGRKYGDHQIDHLHETLDDANCTMSENEKLLSNYRTTNIRQSTELEDLRSKLERSRDELSSRSSSPQQVVHFTVPSPVVHSGDDKSEHTKLLSELEQEKLSKQRAEIERLHLMELLDASFRGHFTCSGSDKVTTELSQHLKNLQDEIKETQMRSSRHDADIDTRLKDIEDTLKKGSAHEKTNHRLAEELEKFKDDIKKREESERSRTELTTELRSLESELSSERKLLDCSRQQSDKLASKVDELGFQLDQMQHEKEKALSCLELTSHHLDKTLSGQEELEKEVRDLKHELNTSEKEKVGWKERCAMLVKECRLQMEREEYARDSMTGIQCKLANCRAEKLAMEEKCVKVLQQLSEKAAEVSQFKEQCNKLQLSLAENISEGKRGEDIKQKLIEVKQECNERKMELCQLKVELKNVGNSNSLLQDQIQLLEDNLCKSEETCKQFEKELTEVSSQLHCKEGDRDTLMKELEMWKAQVCCLISEKEQLELEISDLKSQLMSTKEATATNQVHALHTAKKHKLKYKQVEQKNIKLQREKEQLQLQMDQLLKDHQEYITELRNQESLLSFVQQENEELKGTVKDLENLKDNQEKEIEQFRHKLSEVRYNLVNRRAEVEKYGVKLKDSQNEREALFRENVLLKQELSQSKDECSQIEQKMALQLHQYKEMSSSQVQDLRRELQSCKEENAQVKEKLAKCSHAYQTLKAELVQVKLEYEHKEKEAKDLEECLEETYLKTSKREQDLSSDFNSLKATHDQELKSLQEYHKQTASKLQQRISKLQIQLADEQSTVRAMRRHQLQLFGDQHKMLQQDLIKSLEDTEALRRKYIEAKRSYEEKEAILEEKVSEKYREENSSLCQQLAKSQSILRQQAEDNEVVLRVAAGEVDELVKKMGKRVHIPVFPTAVEQESNTKNWTAEIMAKFQWLQKEVGDVVAMEIRQRRKLKEQQLLRDQRCAQMNS